MKNTQPKLQTIEKTDLTTSLQPTEQIYHDKGLGSFFTGDKLNHAKANKEVILSDGAIGSPHLLQISGIGDSEKIKNHYRGEMRNVQA